jgi:hypothetical protein
MSKTLDNLVTRLEKKPRKSRTPAQRHRRSMDSYYESVNRNIGKTFRLEKELSDLADLRYFSKLSIGTHFRMVDDPDPTTILEKIGPKTYKVSGPPGHAARGLKFPIEKKRLIVRPLR